MMTRHLWKTLAAALLATLAGSAAAAQPLTAELSTSKAAYTPTEAIELRLTIRNVSSAPVAVLGWKLPFRGVQDDIFVVTRDGARVPYTGPVFKRLAPTAADYVRIPAGGELTGSFDLAGAYAVEAGGNVTVRFQLPLTLGYVTSRSALSGTLVSETAMFLLDPRPIADGFELDEPDEAAAEYVSPAFRSCSATRQALIKTALASAQTYATGGYNHLVANPRGSARYTRWFGTFNSSRFLTVKTHFSKIKTAVATKRFTFDCNCSLRGVFAYVYRNRPYQMWLCPVFWQVRNTGQDSKAGTIIHEASHYTVVANTVDIVYGPTASRALARYYPSYAIWNADNHSYFVELK